MIPYRGSAGRQNTTWRENKSTGIGCRHVAPILQPSRAQSSSGSGGVEAGSRDSAAAAGAKLPPAGAYQQLPDSFWDERRILYNRMRHERDRANRRARLKQLRWAGWAAVGPGQSVPGVSLSTASFIFKTRYHQWVLAMQLHREYCWWATAGRLLVCFSFSFWAGRGPPRVLSIQICSPEAACKAVAGLTPGQRK